MDGSLQLLVKWSRAPLAAGGAATTGKDAMVTLTLRAPVHFWRNSVFLSLLVSCLCVAVYLPFPFRLCMPASHILALVPIIHADLLPWPPARATGLGFLTEGERSHSVWQGGPLSLPHELASTWAREISLTGQALSKSHFGPEEENLVIQCASICLSYQHSGV